MIFPGWWKISKEWLYSVLPSPNCFTIFATLYFHNSKFNALVTVHTGNLHVHVQWTQSYCPGICRWTRKYRAIYYCTDVKMFCWRSKRRSFFSHFWNWVVQVTSTIVHVRAKYMYTEKHVFCKTESRHEITKYFSILETKKIWDLTIFILDRYKF